MNEEDKIEEKVASESEQSAGTESESTPESNEIDVTTESEGVV